MRRFIFDHEGRARLYATGAGVLYNSSNRAVGFLVGNEVMDLHGRVRGFFEDGFLRDSEGAVAGFVKGSVPEGELDLPPTQAPTFKAAPQPASMHPFVLSIKRPEFRWIWSNRDIELLLQTRVDGS